MTRCLRCFLSFGAVACALAPLAACGGKALTDIPVTTTAAQSPELQALIQYVKGQMTSCSIPGAAVAVVRRGKPVEAAGIGVMDPVTAAPVKPSTLFGMGAASTPIVALAALSLARDNKLDLSHPVTDYVPLELASGYDPTTITVGELLLHTSGMPENHNPTAICGTQPADWFATNGAPPLWAPPGAVWNFSHIGYGVAGWAVAAAAGQTFADAATARVLGPAGMKTATYDPAVAAARGLAAGRDVDPSTGQVTPKSSDYTQCAFYQPIDGLYASVLDYAALGQTLLAGGGTMLDAAGLGLFETGQVPDYQAPGGQFTVGMYEHEAFQGVTALHMGGTAGGYSSYFWLVPSQGLAVVVAFGAYNYGSGCSAYDAASFAVSDYLHLPSSAAIDWTTPPSAWTPYVGSYVDPVALGTVNVTIDGDALAAADSSYGVVTLTPSSAAAFHATFASSPPVLVSFQPDGARAGGWFVTPYGVAKRN